MFAFKSDTVLMMATTFSLILSLASITNAAYTHTKMNQQEVIYSLDKSIEKMSKEICGEISAVRQVITPVFEMADPKHHKQSGEQMR